jgi:hypothetical protein
MTKREPRLRPPDFDRKLRALYAHGSKNGLPTGAAELIEAIGRLGLTPKGIDAPSLSRVGNREEGLNKQAWHAILEIYGLAADCPEFWRGTIKDFRRHLKIIQGSVELALKPSNFGQPFADLFRMERVDARRDGVLIGHTIHVKPQPVPLYERDGHVAKRLIGYFGISDAEVSVTPGKDSELSVALAEHYYEFSTGEFFSWIGDEETYLFRIVAKTDQILGATRSDFELGRPYTFSVVEISNDSVITISAFARGPFAFGSPSDSASSGMTEEEEEAERRIRDLANKYIEREFYKNAKVRSGSLQSPLVTAADGHLADRLLLAEKRYGRSFESPDE